MVQDPTKLKQGDSPGFSLYFHIPYCSKKCPYCDFNTYALPLFPEKEYVTALLCELDYRSSQQVWASKKIKSIYFGGGTPSLFSSESIEKLIKAVLIYFNGTMIRQDGEDSLEVTVECNPTNLTKHTLEGYRQAGVNRLSIGAQSFNNQLLGILGRDHFNDHIVQAFETSRHAGFKNISIDLMYGIPTQNDTECLEDLHRAVHLNPEHISVYGLTIEKGTPYYQSYKKGILKLPSEKVLLKMMEYVEVFLPSHGYTRYEISNFSKEGFQAQHNKSYWDGNDYLGIGAGAHSFIRGEGLTDEVLELNTPYMQSQMVQNDEYTVRKKKNYGIRWSNTALPEQYIKDVVTHGTAISWKDELELESSVFEFFFLGLRKIEGVNLTLFTEIFGFNFLDLYKETFYILSHHDLVKLENNYLSLTKKGLRLSDSVIENFILDTKKIQRVENS
jgi:oxygen-independent coproporphyrinogen III oxidase